MIIFVYFINTSNNFYLTRCSMMENLWKFITWTTPKTRTEFHINLCDHRRDNVSAQQAKLNRLRNTKQHIFAVWRKERERERGVGWSMANRYKACVSLSALSLITAQFLPFYFIWRIYGDFYHKYFACFHFILIFLLLLLVCLFFPWGVSSK